MLEKIFITGILIFCAAFLVRHVVLMVIRKGCGGCGCSCIGAKKKR